MVIYYVCAFLTVSFVLSGIDNKVIAHVNYLNVGMETAGVVSLPSLELQTVICPRGFLVHNLVQCRCPTIGLLFQLIVLV